MTQYNISEIDKILQAIASTPVNRLRLLNSDGKVLTTYNKAGVSNVEHFQKRILPYLTSDVSAPGIYTVEGAITNMGKGDGQKILAIEKKGHEVVAQPQIVIQEKPNTIPGNLDLIKENAELKYKTIYLEAEIDRLNIRIEELEEELNEEPELAEAPKEPIALLLEGLLPTLKPYIEVGAAHLINKYLAPPQPKDTNEGT